jgi:hypothetical protein
MPKVEVSGFDARGPLEDPKAFGFIEFNDGMRIGYSPGSRGTNEDGLFNCQQPYLIEKQGLELRAAHITAATQFVKDVLQERRSADAGQ